MYGEACFSQKIFTKEPETKRQTMKWKHTDYPLKKRFQTQRGAKKVMLTVFCNMKGPMTIDFVEKGATLNSASHCQLFRQNSPYILNEPHTFFNISIFITICDIHD